MNKDVAIAGKIHNGAEGRQGVIVADKESGLIKEVLYGDKHKDNMNCDICYTEEYSIYPGDINGHSHPEQSLYTDMVDKSWDLATWCRNTIYKYSPLLKPEHVYYACCRAFSRMLGFGETSVFVSFYCHNNRGNEYDMAVIKAAQATGLRLYFGRMNYDIITPEAYEAKKRSQHCYYETVEEADRNFKQLYDMAKGSTVVVAPAIHSIHASTGPAIENAIKLGNQYDRYVQFHLSEDNGDVELSQKWYGMRPIEYLVSLVEKGVVTSLENLLLSDCIWVNDNELNLIKQYGMKVVLNPRMNDRVKAGEAKLAAFIERGIPLYLGTDGEASNDDLSITGEMSYLERKFESLGYKPSSYFGAQPLKYNRGHIGNIEKGSYCDLKVMRNNAVADVYVGGQKVVAAGVLQRMDSYKEVELPLMKLIEELMERYDIEAKV